jgi:TonB family protein
MERGQNGWIQWMLPGAASLLAHTGLALTALAVHVTWHSGANLIEAQVLDIADSNSPKSPPNLIYDNHAAHAVSNQEMVERLNLPMGFPRDLKCSVAVAVAYDGKVVEAMVTRSSGNLQFDRSIIAAVFKSSPFPRPSADQLEAGIYRFELKLGEDG